MNDMSEDMQMFTYPLTKLTRLPDGDVFQEASHLNIFYNIHPVKEYKTKTRAINVKLIPKTVRETCWMLKHKLDSLVLKYDDELNMKFVSMYRTVRKINEKPGRRIHYTILVKGKVKVAETDLVLSDVTIETGAKKEKTKTDYEGYYAIRIYNKDADVITFNLEGYESLTLSMQPKPVNHEVIIDVEMKKLLVIW